MIIISFMQSIYTHIPETNYVPREYSVAAILLLLFMVLISLVSVLNLLYFYISTFRSVIIIIINGRCSNRQVWYGNREREISEDKIQAYMDITCMRWRTALQAGRPRVRFPMVSLEFFIDKILLTALRPWGRLSL